MSVQLTLITFSPNTTIKSADINANFQQVLAATKFYGAYGAINNVNVLVTIDDFTINVENNIRAVPCSRYRHDASSSDRGHSFSVKTSGTYYDGMIMDSAGRCHFHLEHPKDKYGNKHSSHRHFTGTGGGFYSHGFVGAIPLSVGIDVDDSTFCQTGFNQLGATTVLIRMSSTLFFHGFCNYYDPD
jgi:hypothetical protein